MAILSMGRFPRTVQEMQWDHGNPLWCLSSSPGNFRLQSLSKSAASFSKLSISDLVDFFPALEILVCSLQFSFLRFCTVSSCLCNWRKEKVHLGWPDQRWWLFLFVNTKLSHIVQLHGETSYSQECEAWVSPAEAVWHKSLGTGMTPSSSVSWRWQ